MPDFAFDGTFCVVCEKSFGPGIRRCCTPSSLLGFRGKVASRSYFELDDTPLSVEDMDLLASKEKSLKRINSSGFLLQMALEHKVRATKTGWRVSATEHHWRNARTEEEGWVDLILEKKNVVVVLECKRALESTWTFLVDSERSNLRSECRVVQNRFIYHPNSGNSRTTTGVAQIQVSPYTHISEYCIHGTKESINTRELIERTAATVLSATEAIARSHGGSVNSNQPVRNYVSMIVTTAELERTIVDSSTISTTTGEVPRPLIGLVAGIRFRKQLWSGEDYPTLQHDATSLSDSGRAKEHTVLVINADHFINFLNEFEPDGEDWAS